MPFFISDKEADEPKEVSVVAENFLEAAKDFKMTGVHLAADIQPQPLKQSLDQTIFIL